jgi:hypothetical protein
MIIIIKLFVIKKSSIYSYDRMKNMVSVEDEWKLLPPLNEEEWHLPNYNIKYKDNVRSVGVQAEMDAEDAAKAFAAMYVNGICTCANCLT